MQLGRMLAADGQNEPAIAELQEALKLAPSDASVQTRPGGPVHQTPRNMIWPKPSTASLLAAKPNDPDLHYGLGRLLLKQRKFPEAEQELIAAHPAQARAGHGLRRSGGGGQ